MINVSNRVALPSQEFRYGISTEDRGSVSVGDAIDVGLEVFVGYDGHVLLEGVHVSTAGEAVQLQVLGVGAAAEDLAQHPRLNLAGVAGHVFDVLEGLGVLVIQGTMLAMMMTF